MDSVPSEDDDQIRYPPAQESKSRRQNKVTILPSIIYLKLQLEGAITELTMSEVIDSATQSLYGIVGSAMLHYEVIPQAEHNQALLKVPIGHHERLWAALTMLSSVSNRPARITVLKATPFWFALFDDHPFA